MSTFKIVRSFSSDRCNITLPGKTGLTEAEAQAHCKDPETNSKTAKSAKAQRYTAKNGHWFDGYKQER